MMSEYRYVFTISIKFKGHINVATSTFYLTFSKSLNIWKKCQQAIDFFFNFQISILKNNSDAD